MTSEKKPLKSNNLLLRFITAFVALAILVAALNFFGVNGAKSLIIIICILLSYEISNMFAPADLVYKYGAALLITTSLFLNIYLHKEPLDLLPIFIGFITLIFLYRDLSIELLFNKVIGFMMIALYCFYLPTYVYEIFKLDLQFHYFYFFFFLVYGTDTFAYFFGKLWGHKWFKAEFQPQISPTKTVEGFIGALLWPAVIILIATQLNLFKFTLLSSALIYVVALAAISGDLIASLIKRKSHTKDSGRLFVGHGGFLDRLDSLLFSAPVFLIATQYFSS